jgi:opacity protein-like surface antigen
MSSRKIYFTPLLPLLLSTSAFAGGIDVEIITQEPAYELVAGDISVILEAGASFSRDITPTLTGGGPLGWDPSPEGYTHDLGTSSVLGGGIGYVINPLLLVEIGADRRNSFSYEKFQTSPATLGSKTRYFELKNTTVMANAFLNGSGLSPRFAYRTTNFIIDPFLNAGAGLSVNTVTNFHSNKTDSDLVFSMMTDNSINSFAYQLGAGVNIRTNYGLGIGIGYRFVDAGNFQSNNYIVDNPDTGAASGLATSTWKSDLKTNEVYLLLSYLLN